MTARFAAASTVTLMTVYGTSIKTKMARKKPTSCILGLANVSRKQKKRILIKKSII